MIVKHMLVLFFDSSLMTRIHSRGSCETSDEQVKFKSLLKKANNRHQRKTLIQRIILFFERKTGLDPMIHVFQSRTNGVWTNRRSVLAEYGLSMC